MKGAAGNENARKAGLSEDAEFLPGLLIRGAPAGVGLNILDGNILLPTLFDRKDQELEIEKGLTPCQMHPPGILPGILNSRKKTL